MTLMFFVLEYETSDVVNQENVFRIFTSATCKSVFCFISAKRFHVGSNFLLCGHLEKLTKINKITLSQLTNSNKIEQTSRAVEDIAIYYLMSTLSLEYVHMSNKSIINKNL